MGNGDHLKNYKEKISVLAKQILPMHYAENGPRKHQEVLVCILASRGEEIRGIRLWMDKSQIASLNLEEEEVGQFLQMYDKIEPSFFELDYCPILIYFSTLEAESFHRLVVKIPE